MQQSWCPFLEMPRKKVNMSTNVGIPQHAKSKGAWGIDELKIKVIYLDRLRRLTGKDLETIELSKGSDVDSLLKVLSEKYGEEFENYVYDESGDVKPYIQFFINGRSVVRDTETELKDTDELVIVFATGGG
jgi:MoaD family protein